MERNQCTCPYDVIRRSVDVPRLAMKLALPIHVQLYNDDMTIQWTRSTLFRLDGLCPSVHPSVRPCIWNGPECAIRLVSLCAGWRVVWVGPITLALSRLRRIPLFASKWSTTTTTTCRSDKPANNTTTMEPRARPFIEIHSNLQLSPSTSSWPPPTCPLSPSTLGHFACSCRRLSGEVLVAAVASRRLVGRSYNRKYV